MRLDQKAEKQKLFVTDGIEFVRTVPIGNKQAPYVGYIRTTKGEAKVEFNNPTLYDVLMTGKEISEDLYVKTKLTVKNDIEI